LPEEIADIPRKIAIFAEIFKKTELNDYSRPTKRDRRTQAGVEEVSLTSTIRK
jgi:hypothetical protein